MNLFVIDTPLQLLNTVEAMAVFPDDDCAIAILLWPHWSCQVFDAIIRDNSLGKVAYFPMRVRKQRNEATTFLGRISDRLHEYASELSQLFFLRRFGRFLSRYSRVRRLFVGNYRNDYMKHVANRVSHRELILLDDGTDTLRVVNERNFPPEVPAAAKAGYMRRLKNAFRTRFLDWDVRQARVVTYFTSYEIEPAGKDSVVRNEYAQLSGRLLSRELSDEVYFLGQPLVADGYLADLEFTAYLDQIRGAFPGKQLYYVPHPRERAADYQGQVTALGFEIRSFSGPVEIALCSAACVPSVVASFFCSALENCSFLFPRQIEIHAFEIPSGDLLCCHRLVADTYAHFRENRPETIRVTPLKTAASRKGGAVVARPG